jgi:hypothetical protein
MQSCISCSIRPPERARHDGPGLPRQALRQGGAGRRPRRAEAAAGVQAAGCSSPATGQVVLRRTSGEVCRGEEGDEEGREGREADESRLLGTQLARPLIRFM